MVDGTLSLMCSMCPWSGRYLDLGFPFRSVKKSRALCCGTVIVASLALANEQAGAVWIAGNSGERP
jgi:hypothetical protein